MSEDTKVMTERLEEISSMLNSDTNNAELDETKSANPAVSGNAGECEACAEAVDCSDAGTEASMRCCGTKTKKRSEKEYKSLMNRLKRIEGQVRGVERMLENDAYCPDIMTQVSAINCALNSFNKVLLASHLRSCVVDDIRDGNDEVIDELVETLQKVMK